MDQVKNYFVGGKPQEEVKKARRNTMRQSIVNRLSGIPSTIDESSPRTDFNTFDALAESSPNPQFNERPSKRFSFVSNVAQEETEDFDIQSARESFRKSMTGAYRKSMWADKTDLSHLTESVIAEEDEDAESQADSEMKEEDHQNILDELKHEIMVNYLFQQQCSRLWIADGTGEVEGVMLRKSRGNYLACPPALAESVFADSCVQLNVPVSKGSMFC